MPFTSPTPAASASPTPERAAIARIPTLLRLTWRSYKTDFIQGDGRVIDHGRDGATTSEGQSYALLRAVWMNDRPTFDLVWRWAHENLQVRPDKLFGYLWGKHPNGRWSILSTASATDADEDIALALIFAAYRWHDPAYSRQARPTLLDIWQHDVASVRGQPYLTAGDWAPRWTATEIAVDPSYLAPYAYRIFARVDPAHPWLKLVDTAYRILAACSSSSLGGRASAGLPPNWCAVVRASGNVASMQGVQRANDYGYDAFRVMWRIALDDVWSGEPRARTYLRASAFLRQQWGRKGALLAEYGHSGTALTTREDPTIYGGDIGNFVVADPSAARAIAASKLLSVFQQQGGVAYWGQRYSYYEQNWVWFGLALVAHQLPNLATSGAAA